MRQFLPYYLIVLLLIVPMLSHGQGDERLISIRSEIGRYQDSIPGLRESANISVANASLRELFRALAETHQLNISLDRVPNVPVHNNFTQVTVGDLLAFLCVEYNLRLRFIGNIILIERFFPDVNLVFEYNQQNDQVSYDFREDTLHAVAAFLTANSPYNITVHPQARNQSVTGFVKGLKFEEGLNQLALGNDLVMENISEKVFLLSPLPPEIVDPGGPESTVTGRRVVPSRRRASRSAAGGFNYTVKQSGTQPLLTVTANKSPTLEVLNQISDELQIGHVMLQEPDGELDCYLVDVTFEEFLTVALATASEPMTYSRDGEIFTIGSETNTNLSRTSVYQFKNRSVELITESLPEQLMTNVEVSEFPDLNALIITGSQQKIQQLTSFFEQIDQPVPNILIEVMVVEVNKGYSLNTGIQAGISDSVPRSAGSVFPGIDITLSSGSMNDFLEKIDRRGIINLGRVTPEFYTTIQALEDNNNLEVRSTPKLSTLNGNEANLTIGRSVYYLIQTQNVAGGVNPIITTTPRYEKVEANLDIKIKPFVSFNEDITLSIESEFSDFIDPTVEGAPPGNATRKFVSKIRVRNSEMVVLGGLEEASESSSASGTPFLSRVPIIKWLFSSRSEVKNDSKLLIFIKPTIVY